MAEPDTFYDYWNDLLDGKRPAFFDGFPQGGCYAMKSREGEGKVPVRIDRASGKIVIWIRDNVVSPEKVGDVWMACGRTAVTFDVYTACMRDGKWPDEAAAMPATPASSGGNNPPPEAVHELLPYTLAQVADWFKKMGEKFTKPEEITAAADHAAALRTLVSKARKLHKDEKAPHLEACREKDEKYLRPVDATEKLLSTITEAVTAFEATQRAVREAEQERAAKEAAAAAKALEAVAAKPEISPEEKQARVDALAAASAAVAKAAGPVVHKSSTGKRGFTVKEVPIATVTDQDTLYAAVRDRPAVKEFLSGLAQKELDSGILLPGVVRTEGLKGK